jgi:hypothetical protein
MTIIEKATKELRKRIKSGEVRCNCGGPQMGTDHSPDCQINLAWDDIIADIKSTGLDNAPRAG